MRDGATTGTNGATEVGGEQTAGPELNELDAQARNALCEENLYLVQHVVNGLASSYPRHVDRQDLWSAGAAGLVEASRRYDPASGVPFGAYAMIRIRGAVIDHTRSRDWATRSLRRDMRRIDEKEQRLSAANGRAPTPAELAEELGMTEQELAGRRAAAVSATLLHLDQPVTSIDGDEVTLGDCVEADQIEALPDDSVEKQELSGTLRTAVRYLPELHKEVVERYFFNGELLREIAETLGVTEARVSQLRAEAVNAMRAYFATYYEAVPEVPADAPGRRRRASYVARAAEQSTWRARLQAGAGILVGATVAESA